MQRSLLATSLALVSLAAVAPAQEILAGLGRNVLSIPIDPTSGQNGNLGVVYLNGEFFVTARGNSGGGVPPHTVAVYDMSGNPVRSFQQAQVGTSMTNEWGWRDGATDGVSLIFGWEGGINVVDSMGNAVNQLVTASGPRPITQPIVAASGPGTHRAIAYDPTGNGGTGSIFVGDFATNIVEIALDGTVLHTFPNPTGVDQYQAYGLAFDWQNGLMWVNSSPNAYEIVEFAVDRTANTMTPTGRRFERREGSFDSIQGGLDIVRGGIFDGRNCGFDLVGIDQANVDRLTVYRVDLWNGYPSDLEPRTLVGRNGGALSNRVRLTPLDTSLEIAVQDAMVGVPYLGFLDVAGSYNPVGPVGPFRGPWEARELTAPLQYTGVVGPSVSIPVSNFAALPLGLEFSLQTVPLDLDLAMAAAQCAVDLPIIATNVATIEYGAPFRVRVVAEGANNFNTDRTSGFFKVQALDGLMGDSIVQVTFDWATTTNADQATMLFDTDQTGMNDAFWNGNASGSTCEGTYRNNSHVVTGLDFTAPQINLTSTCATSGANSGVEAANPGTGTNDFKTLTWRFTPGQFTAGETLEMDIDTDGGLGTGGEDMVGMVVTVTLQSGTVLTGQLGIAAFRRQLQGPLAPNDLRTSDIVW